MKDQTKGLQKGLVNGLLKSHILHRKCGVFGPSRWEHAGSGMASCGRVFCSSLMFSIGIAVFLGLL